MSDMMEFPQTVEEFMEQYKVVDTDHIYSNGTVFVPIFRMKQWFDHVESENDHVEVVRCKDCKWWNTDWYKGVYKACPNVFSAPDWFCADGERKDTSATEKLQNNADFH